MPRNPNPKLQPRKEYLESLRSIPFDVRSRVSSQPLDIIHITSADQLPTQGLSGWARESLAKRWEAIDPLGLAGKVGLHPANVLVSQVSRGPGCGIVGSRGKGREDVEGAAARQLGGGLVGEVEVELAGLARGGGGEIKGQQRGDVGGMAVLEDLAVGKVVVHGAGPHFVLRSVCRLDDVGPGRKRSCDIDGRKSRCEANDGKCDGRVEELHDGDFGLQRSMNETTRVCIEVVEKAMKWKMLLMILE